MKNRDGSIRQRNENSTFVMPEIQFKFVFSIPNFVFLTQRIKWRRSFSRNANIFAIRKRKNECRVLKKI